MQSAANLIANQAAQIQSFLSDPLAGKSGIAMNQ
jgi:hypothetical protein